MGRLTRRIARIKLTPFRDAVDALVPGALPDEVPAMIRCPMPSHDDRTASFSVRDVGWHCFGACGAGGDALDFVGLYHGVDLADSVALLEGALGITLDADSDAVFLIASASASASGALRPPSSGWTIKVAGVEAEFFDRVRSYLRCRDTVVLDLSWPVAEYVFGAISEVQMVEPSTVRGRRDAVRRLRRWALDHAQGIEDRVLDALGKDAIDVARQSV